MPARDIRAVKFALIGDFAASQAVFIPANGVTSSKICYYLPVNSHLDDAKTP
jgi:hypothetical protein